MSQLLCESVDRTVGGTEIMKEGIHPKYQKIKAVCACGSEVELGSVLPEINVEICSACHPFFTGKQKLVDTAGRIEKFKQRYAQHYAEKAEKQKG